MRHSLADHRSLAPTSPHPGDATVTSASQPSASYAMKVAPVPPPRDPKKKKSRSGAPPPAGDLLFYESQILINGSIPPHPSIPALPPKAYGEANGFRYLCMQKLSCSIGDKVAALRGVTPAVAASVAVQVLDCLRHVHKARFIFRDLKPENLLLGPAVAKQGKAGVADGRVYLVDYGIAEKFIGYDGVHAPMMETGACVGTPRFASVNVTLGRTGSRRDDVEALGYILVYLVKGELPWDGARVASDAELGQVKLSTPLKSLCAGLPPPFEALIASSRALEYTAEPDYAGLIVAFEQIASNVDVIDWQPAVRAKAPPAPVGAARASPAARGPASAGRAKSPVGAADARSLATASSTAAGAAGRRRAAAPAARKPSRSRSPGASSVRRASPAPPAETSPAAAKPRRASPAPPAETSPAVVKPRGASPTRRGVSKRLPASPLELAPPQAAAKRSKHAASADATTAAAPLATGAAEGAARSLRRQPKREASALAVPDEQPPQPADPAGESSRRSGVSRAAGVR
jgi:serine/threonine protein kinase